MTTAQSILMIHESAGMYAQNQALKMCESLSIWAGIIQSNNVFKDGAKEYGFADGSELVLYTNNSMRLELNKGLS